MVSKRAVIALIAVIAVSTAGIILVLGPMLVPPPADYREQMVIFEVNYLPSAPGEFIELYVWENESLDITGWTIALPEGVWTLPTITGLSIFDFILLRWGTGVNDLNASDGLATVYLSTGLTEVLPAAGEATLSSATGQLIDFIAKSGAAYLVV